LAKKKKPVIKRAPTAGERAKWQKHKRRQHLIFIMGVLVILAVLVLLGFGYYDRVYQPDHEEANKLHKTVVQVNEAKFSVEYVIDVMSFLNKQQQQQDTLQSYTIDDIAQKIEYDELLQQAAPELGISVSEDEVLAKLKSEMLPEDAPEDLTDAQFLKYYRAVLKAEHISDKEFRSLVISDMLRTKLLDYLKAQVPKSAEQVHVQGVLVEKSMATEVADRLVFTGDSLAAVADEVSLYTASQGNGGDLGWLPRGIMDTKFEEVVFALEPGVLSQPIDDKTSQSTGGVWLVSVLEKQPDRAVEDSQAQSLANVAHGNWFEQQLQKGLDSGQVVNNLDDATRTWATEYMAEHPTT
jgi:parvulin-like peptidyl-prolyl isomerase